MNRHSDPACFSEAEVTLVDHQAGHQWDLGEADDDSLATVPECAGAVAPRGRAATVPEPLPDIVALAQTAAPLTKEGSDASIDAASPTLTAASLRKHREWKRGATEARRSLAERRDEREALARVLAMARPRPRLRPRPTTNRTYPRPRSQNN